MAKWNPEWDKFFDITGGPGNFKARVMDQIYTISWWDLGNELIAEMVKRARGKVYDTDINIEYAPGKFETQHEINKSVTYCDLDYFEKNVSSPIEPTMLHVLECKKTYVYLFHELVHFFHGLEGTYQSSYGMFHPQEEFRTTGLYNYANNQRFSENKFRQQILLKRRPCYFFKSRDVLFQTENQERERFKLPQIPNFEASEFKFPWPPASSEEGFRSIDYLKKDPGVMGTTPPSSAPSGGKKPYKRQSPRRY